MPAGRKKKVEEEGATPDKQKNLGAPKTWCPERKEKALAGVKRRILSQTDGVGLQMIFARVAHSADGESKSVQSTRRLRRRTRLSPEKTWRWWTIA